MGQQLLIAMMLKFKEYKEKKSFNTLFLTRIMLKSRKFNIT